MNIREHVNLLRARVRACQATHEQIASATHGVVSASWVSKFAVGRMRNPRMDSLIALSTALDCVDRSSCVIQNASYTRRATDQPAPEQAA